MTVDVIAFQNERQIWKLGGDLRLASHASVWQSACMLAIRLDKATDARLSRWSRQTCRTKLAHARQAILDHLDELDDAQLAMQRLAHPVKIHTSREVKRAVGL